MFETSAQSRVRNAMVEAHAERGHALAEFFSMLFGRRH